jgi:tetratricopeptide (TPR) repeat protein
MPLKIFISTVTKEFHRTAPVYRVKFTSYRDLLALHLRREFKGCQIVVQEELVQGTSDLLGTLDQEIQSCDFEIHIIGDAAGARPRENELEKLRARHPGFLDAYHKLRDDLLDWSQVSYTQWEAYLAFHHDNKRLIFKAEPSAPRNPEYVVDSQEKETQVAHLGRIRCVGEHYQGFYSQSDLVIKTIRSILSSQSLSLSTSVEATELARRVEAVLRKKSKEPPESYDPSRIDQYFQAVQEAAKEFGLDRFTAIRILDEYSRLRKEALESESAIEAHRELAELALANGEYQEAIIQARSWIDKATQLLSIRPERFESTREQLLDGYQYWHDAAVLYGNLEEAVIAVKDGLRHIDRDSEPIAWADFMEPLFRSAMASGDYKLADEVLDSIIDIREEHQAQSQELARSLFAWASLMKDTGKYQGALDVTQRLLGDEFKEILNLGRYFQLDVIHKGFEISFEIKALRKAGKYALRYLEIANNFFTPNDPIIAFGLNNLARFLVETNRHSEAEPLYRRALDIYEASYGPNHPNVASGLNNLANLLQETNRHSEAEPLYRRALAIVEASYGPNHSGVATGLSNLALLLQQTNRHSEAEPLFRRALDIDEASYGPDHPNVATGLNNLARLLRETNRHSEAEPLFRRALEIDEASYGPNHPRIAIRLNILAALLYKTNRHSEAESLFRRALEIDEASYGPNHPCVARGLKNLANLLQETNRHSEAEPLMRRSLLIGETSLGPDHPGVAASLNNLARLLSDTNRTGEAEPLVRRALSIDEASLGSDHPDVATSLNNLARLLSDTNRKDEAEPLFRRSLQILIDYRKSTGYSHPKYEAFKTSYSDHLKSLGYSPEKIDQTLEEIAAEVISKQSSNEAPPFE